MALQVLGPLIASGVLIVLALLGVAVQMGRMIGRIDSLKEIGLERQKTAETWRREHLDRHNTEATWWERVKAHYDSHAHTAGGGD